MGSTSFVTTHSLPKNDQSDNGPSNFDNAPVAGNVSERSISVGSNSTAFCSLPQCDTCLALLQSHQNSLAPAPTSCANSVRSQLDNSSHASSQNSINKMATFGQPNVVCLNSSATMADTQRKISIMSTMSTDSDYVSDTNNLYFDGTVRKLSDVQNCHEIPNADLFNYMKPASCNLSLNLSAVSASKSSVKDQSCQTPEYPLDCVDLNGDSRFPDPRGAQLPLSDYENFDDPKRKISNISTISTLSSLSTESASTFDTITLGQDVATCNEDTVLVLKGDECSPRKYEHSGLQQVSHTTDHVILGLKHTFILSFVNLL